MSTGCYTNVRCITQMYGALLYIVLIHHINIHRRGFLRCSFRLQGNAKASICGMSDRVQISALSFYNYQAFILP